MQFNKSLPAATFDQYNGKVVSFWSRHTVIRGRVVEGYVYANAPWLLIELNDELVVQRADQCTLVEETPVESNPAT